MDLSFRLSGAFKVLVNGVEKASFPNMILDQGLDDFVDKKFLTFCSVGDSSIAPAASQTTLQSHIAAASYALVEQDAQALTPYYWSTIVTYNFAVGAAQGNLREIGVGSASNRLFSRALLLDINGSPTTIPITATDILQIQYILKFAPNTSDVTTVLPINTISATLTTRASKVNIPLPSGLGTTITLADSTFALKVYDVDISATPIGEPSGGTSANPSSTNKIAYSAGSNFFAVEFIFGITTANFNIQSWTFRTVAGNWQTECNPYLAKDSTKTLKITMRLVWSR